MAGLLLVGNSPNAAADRQQPGSQLTIIRSTPESIVVALTVEHYEIETLSHDGEQYQRVLIPDTVQTVAPGAPQVPTRGALLGLPATDGVSTARARGRLRNAFAIQAVPRAPTGDRK